MMMCCLTGLRREQVPEDSLAVALTAGGLRFPSLQSGCREASKPVHRVWKIQIWGMRVQGFGKRSSCKVGNLLARMEVSSCLSVQFGQPFWGPSSVR